MTLKLHRAAAGLCLGLMLLGCASPTLAQQQIPDNAMGPNGSYRPTSPSANWGVDSVTHAACIIGATPYDANCGNPILGNFTVTASTSPFAPITPSPTLAVTTTSANVALTAGGTSVLVYNSGAVAAEVVLGNSSVAATTTATPIPPGTMVPIAVGSAGYIAAISGSGSTSLTITSFTGSLASGWGGGGSGGAITAAVNAMADGSFITWGKLTDAPCLYATLSSCSAMGVWEEANAQLIAMNALVAGQTQNCSATPFCTGSIGGVNLFAQAASAANFPGCTVGTSSAQCLAASTATQFLQVQNTSVSATVACAWGATAALNSAGSFQLAAGQASSWGPNTAGVRTSALNCIASAASTPVYLEWK